MKSHKKVLIRFVPGTRSTTLAVRLKKSLRGLFQQEKQKVRFLLFSIFQPASEKCRHLPAPNRSLLKNEVFNKLLAVLFVSASLTGCSTVLPTGLTQDIKSSSADGLVVIATHVHFGFRYNPTFELSFVDEKQQNEFRIRPIGVKKNGAPLLNTIPVEYDDGFGGIQLLRVKAGHYRVATVETKSGTAPIFLAPGIIVPMTVGNNAKIQINAPISFMVEAGKINFIGEILLGPGSFVGPGPCHYEALHRLLDKHDELRSLQRVSAPLDGVGCMTSKQRTSLAGGDNR